LKITSLLHFVSSTIVKKIKSWMIAAILSDIFCVALKRAVFVALKRADSNFCEEILTTVFEHCSLYLVSKPWSKLDHRERTPFSNDQKSNTPSVAAVMTSRYVTTLRDVTSNGSRLVSGSRECTSTIARTVHTYCNNLHSLEATFFVPPIRIAMSRDWGSQIVWGLADTFSHCPGLWLRIMKEVGWSVSEMWAFEFLSFFLGQGV